MAYTTTALVKTYAGVDGTDDDTLIDSLIDRAEDMIDNYVGFAFDVSADTTRNFTVGRDTEGRFLWFDQWIASITTVTNGDPDGTEVTSSEYTTIPKNRTPYYGIKILGSASKAWEYDNDPEDALSVTGKWGWSTTAPNDIIHASIRLTTFLYRQKDSSMELDRPIITDAGVTILPAGVPKDVLQILNNYKRRGI